MQQRLSAPAGELAINGWRRQQIVHRAQALLHTCPKPVIAAVNGAASGLGADTAMACDFIIGSEHASFTWSYILRGIMPDGGGMYFLPRRIGLSKAKQLIFTGRRVEADEALALGILDRQVKADQLLEAAHDWARELSQVSMTALGLTKTIINQSFEMGSHEVFAQGSQAQGICYTSTEHRAAVEAFLAKLNA
jgi:enoyl-CoA hydratase/carnithine racemase